MNIRPLLRATGLLLFLLSCIVGAIALWVKPACAEVVQCSAPSSPPSPLVATITEQMGSLSGASKVAPYGLIVEVYSATTLNGAQVNHAACGAQITGATNIAFGDDNPDTITRTGGSWIDDGFEAGERIDILNAEDLGNRLQNQLISSVTATVLTMDAGVTLTANAADTTASMDAAIIGGKTDELCDHDIVARFEWGNGDTSAWTTGAYQGVLTRDWDDNINLGGTVYKTSGNKTITAHVSLQGNDDTETYNVTVVDPDVLYAGSKTTCIANSLPTAGAGGCPAGANVQASSAPISMSTGNRYLYLGTDTFTSTSTITIPSGLGGGNEPFYMSSYGTGKARFEWADAHNGDGFNCANAVGARIYNIEVHDITPRDQEYAFTCLNGSTGGNQMRELHIVDVDVTGFPGFFFAGVTNTGSPDYHDGLVVADSSHTQPATCAACSTGGQNNYFVDMPHQLLLGNDLGPNLHEEHTIRSHGSAMSFWAHNDIGEGNVNRATIAARANNGALICGGPGGALNQDTIKFGVPADGVSDCSEDNDFPDNHHLTFAFNHVERAQSGHHLPMLIEPQNNLVNENHGMMSVIGNAVTGTVTCTSGGCDKGFILEAGSDTLYKYNYVDQQLLATNNSPMALLNFQPPGEEVPDPTRTQLIGNVIAEHIDGQPTIGQRLTSLTKGGGTYWTAIGVGNLVFADDTDAGDTVSVWADTPTFLDVGNAATETYPFTNATPISRTTPFEELDDGVLAAHQDAVTFDWRVHRTLDGLCRPASTTMDRGPFDKDAIACR